LDQEYTYEVLEKGLKKSELNLTVKMAPDGTFYFDSGKGRLYFGKHENTFYFYQIEGNDPYLHIIFSALPRLPLGYREHLSWEDYIPIGIISRGLKKAVFLFLSSFYHGLARISGEFSYKNKRLIEGRISANILQKEAFSQVVIDEELGFQSVRFNDFEFRRVDNASRSK